MKQIKLRLNAIEKALSLEIINVSPTPIRIWSMKCSWGYDSIYFQVSERNRNKCLIRRKPTIWTVNLPDAVTIQPGQAHVEKFDLTDETWDLSGLINLQPDIDFYAVIEIVPDTYTIKFNVIEGRSESNKLQLKSYLINK